MRDTVGFGQVDLLLVALVVLDVEGLRRGSRWAGVGTGLAAAVELTPAVFVVLLLVRRPRAALTATAAAALATLAAWLVAPGASGQFWNVALYHTSRVGRVDLVADQALSGALARTVDATHAPLALWLVLAGLVGARGVVRAVGAVRAGDDLAALALVGLTGVLVSPVSWTHHLSSGVLVLAGESSCTLACLALLVLLPVSRSRTPSRAAAPVSA